MFETVRSPKALRNWARACRLAGLCAFDTETTGIDNLTAELVGVSLSFEDPYGDIRSCYIPIAHNTEEKQLGLDYVLDTLAPLFADPAVEKVGQNALYDMVLLGRYGCVFANVHDTMMQDYVLTVGRELTRNMDIMAERYLDGYVTSQFAEVVVNNNWLHMRDFRDVRLDHATFYAAEDTAVTLALFTTLRAKLTAKPRLLRVYEEIDRPLLPVLAEMRLAGIGVSRKRVRTVARKVIGELDILATEIDELACGVEFGSNQKLASYLFGTLGLAPVKVTKGGAPSVDAESLEALADQSPVVEKILEYRKLEKVESTYTGPLLERLEKSATGRISTELKATRTNTGRFSSSDPNLQNIPKNGALGDALRHVFVAPKGRAFVGADYSGIEVRVLMHMANEVGMIEDCILAASKGWAWDPHAVTTKLAFGVSKGDISDKEFGDLRREAKTVLFGVLYGSTAMGVAHNLRIMPHEAQEIIDQIMGGLPAVRDWIDRQHRQAAKSRYVYTAFGRRLFVGSGFGSDRRAQNYPIQGSAADLMRLAMQKVHDELIGLDAQLLLSVHDELIVECAENIAEDVEKLVVHNMVHAADDFIEWRLPIEVDAKIGQSWHEVH